MCVYLLVSKQFDVCLNAFYFCLFFVVVVVIIIVIQTHKFRRDHQTRRSKNHTNKTKAKRNRTPNRCNTYTLFLVTVALGHTLPPSLSSSPNSPPPPLLHWTPPIIPTLPVSMRLRRPLTAFCSEFNFGTVSYSLLL